MNCWAPPPCKELKHAPPLREVLQHAPPPQSVMWWCTQPKRNKAIPIMGSASDREISSRTEGLEWVDLGIPAARADTSGASLTLDTRLGNWRTDLEYLGVADRMWRDSGRSAETWRDSGRSAETWRDSGRSAETWRDSGRSAETWRDSGRSAETWRDSGRSAETWRDSGRSAETWRNSGRSAGDVAWLVTITCDLAWLVTINYDLAWLVTINCVTWLDSWRSTVTWLMTISWDMTVCCCDRHFMSALWCVRHFSHRCGVAFILRETHSEQRANSQPSIIHKVSEWWTRTLTSKLRLERLIYAIAENLY